MRKYNVVISATMAAFLAMPSYAATVTWDPTGVTGLTTVIKSVWEQAGDHTVYIPAGNHVDGKYNAYVASNFERSQIIWEQRDHQDGNGNIGMGSATRQASTITIQGAGVGSTIIGATNSSDQNGWNRVNAVRMDGIRFKDMTIQNYVGGMFGLLDNGVHGTTSNITFENTNLFLGASYLVGRTMASNRLNFVNTNLLIRSGAAGDAINNMYWWTDGPPSKDLMKFDSSSRISKWNTTAVGANWTASSDAARYTASNYSASVTNVANLAIRIGGGAPSGYVDSNGFMKNSVFATNYGNEYFTTSLGGAGAAGWTSNTGVPVAGSGSVVPEIDPAGMGSVLALVAGGLGLLERRRRK